MDPSITSHFINVENRNIHYLSAGSGDVILLLHGWPTSAYLWRNIMPILSMNYHVIAMDLPGFGKSDKFLDDSYSFKYYERIISAFLIKKKIEKITLGVHDVGGPLGLFWALRNKNQLDKLILFNTLVYPEVSWAVKLFGLATVLPFIKDVLTSPGGIKWAIKFGVFQKHKLNQEIFRNYQEPFADKISRKVLRKTVQNLSPKGFVEISNKLSSFTGPVQIIYGEKDKILPDVSETMKRVAFDLPQTKIFPLPECGHFLQEDEPEKIGNLILEFMKER